MTTKQGLWLEIIQQMEHRRQLGLKQYGVPVTSDSNVNWRNHLSEELLDALVYNLAAGEVEKKYKTLLNHVANSYGITTTEVEDWMEKMYATAPNTI